MRELFFATVAVAVAELCAFLLLIWKFRSDCSGSYQRRAMTAPVREVIVMHEPIASNAVADALLMLAVAKHVKGGDIRRHIELAQVAKEEMASGIECGAMEEAARNEFIKILKNRKA